MHLALLTGMRRSELLGLPLSAVDVDGGVLRVVQALARVRGMGYELRPPKTAPRSPRDLPIPRGD